jgi:Protein of unknown function (DUF2637)
MNAPSQTLTPPGPGLPGLSQPGPSQPGPSGEGPARDQVAGQVRGLRVWALMVLVPVAVIGAVLSFQSLYRAAVPVFGDRLALGFPLLVDFLILGASLQYVAGAKIGRPRAGWRWTAHAGVAGTLALNAMAAHGLDQVPWHVTAPAVWSVLVELTAREVLGQWRAAHAPAGEAIPLRLWLTAPVESARTWLRLARRVAGEQAAARVDVGLHAAAVEALKLALPRRRDRQVRRILQRQLRAGSLPPAAVLGPLGWLNGAQELPTLAPQQVLRAVLRDLLSQPQSQPLVPVQVAVQVEPSGSAPAIEAGTFRTVDRTSDRAGGRIPDPTTSTSGTVRADPVTRTAARESGQESGQESGRESARTVARQSVRESVRESEAGVGRGSVAGGSGRRTEEELLRLVRSAIADGTLAPAPSGTAIHRVLGGGKGPALRVAQRLAGPTASSPIDTVTGTDSASGDGAGSGSGAGASESGAGGPVIHLVHERAEVAS